MITMNALGVGLGGWARKAGSRHAAHAAAAAASAAPRHRRIATATNASVDRGST